MPRPKQRRIEQAAAMPYRWRGGQPEFCLITSRKGLWGFPKGIIDDGDTPEETAAKEAHEEAGLKGVIEPPALGQFRYVKWGARLRVNVFLMRVTRQDDRYLEADWRNRLWCRPAEARRRLARKALRTLLAKGLEQLDRKKQARRTG